MPNFLWFARILASMNTFKCLIMSNLSKPPALYVYSLTCCGVVYQVLKLHTKLGKPIPSTDPVVVTTASASTTTKSAASTSGGGKPAAPTAAPTAKKVLATPKITFVGELCSCVINHITVLGIK